MPGDCLTSEIIMQEKPLANNDAGVQKVTIISDRFDPIPIPPRPRNYYTPLHVAHDVEAVRIKISAVDPHAKINIDGISLLSNQEMEPIRLKIGRNVIQVGVTARDGTTKKYLALTVFRGYPVPAWTKISGTSPWTPRDSAGELVFNNQMWLLGGFIPALTNDVWCSDDGIKWIQTGMIPTAKGIDIPVAFVFKDRMWVTDIEGNLFSSPDGAKWMLVTDRAPWKGRQAAGGTVFKGKIWIMGGLQNGKLLNDIWSSPDGEKWKMETDCAPWPKRQIHNNLMELDNKLWLIGGGIIGSAYHPFQAYNDVWNSADGVHWEKIVGNAPWTPRIWSSSVVYKDRLWLLGGFRSEPAWENLGDVWYSADGVNWHQLTAVPTCRHSGGNNVPVVVANSIWAPRHESSAYVFNDAIWMVGGMVWPLVNDVWRLAIPGFTFITEPVVEGYVNALYSYTTRADFNNSRKPVSYRLIESPEWLTVDLKTGLISGIPPDTGDIQVTVEAGDETGETVCQRYTLHILAIT